MRDGDSGDDSRFTDVQIMDEANSPLVVLFNWSPMSIKTTHQMSLQLG